MIHLTSLQNTQWTNLWAGNWSLLSCSHFAEQYTSTLIVSGKVFINKAVILVHGRKSAGYALQTERDEFCRYVATEAIANPERINQVILALKQEADSMFAFLDAHTGKDMTLELYDEFWERILQYYILHVHAKFVVEYLPENFLQKVLPALQDARLYVESVFERCEHLIRTVAESVAQKSGYTAALILCMVKEEFRTYLLSGALPDKKILEQRFKAAAIVADKGKVQVYVEEEAVRIESIVRGQQEVSSLQGATAFPGVVAGTVRIILDPSKASHFKEGDILVTGMTRPDYLPIMHKAAAFVTDSGGILSHAAITARELKKPCVIGTQVATKAFKDGDIVEVDATNGTVRKVS